MSRAEVVRDRSGRAQPERLGTPRGAFVAKFRAGSTLSRQTPSLHFPPLATRRAHEAPESIQNESGDNARACVVAQTNTPTTGRRQLRVATTAPQRRPLSSVCYDNAPARRLARDARNAPWTRGAPPSRSRGRESARRMDDGAVRCGAAALAPTWGALASSAGLGLQEPPRPPGATLGTRGREEAPRVRRAHNGSDMGGGTLADHVPACGRLGRHQRSRTTTRKVCLTGP